MNCELFTKKKSINTYLSFFTTKYDRYFCGWDNIRFFLKYIFQDRFNNHIFRWVPFQICQVLISRCDYYIVLKLKGVSWVLSISEQTVEPMNSKWERLCKPAHMHPAFNAKIAKKMTFLPGQPFIKYRQRSEWYPDSWFIQAKISML